MHVTELSMYRSPDSELLGLAAGTGRVIITADLDFPRLLAALGSTGPGLILLRGWELQRVRKPGLCAARADVDSANRTIQLDCLSRS